jgi:hypothetical protein
VSQLRLYLDEDTMRRSLVFALRARNIDVLSAAEAEMINRSDEDHLVAASLSDRALVSYNVGDYCALHEQWMRTQRPHAGIIVAPQQRHSVGEELRRLTRVISAFTSDQMKNRLEFLSSWD